MHKPPFVTKWDVIAIIAITAPLVAPALWLLCVEAYLPDM
jgi:hypothetical protein